MIKSAPWPVREEFGINSWTMGSGINQTNTHAGGPVASILLSHDRDPDGSPRLTNPTIGNDRLERSQLTFSSMTSGLHTTFPWQPSYCPTSTFLDPGFMTASTMQAMDVHRQHLYNCIDRDLARRTIPLNHESINQLQLERYNRLRFDSSRRSGDIDVRGFVTDPRAGTIVDQTLESSKRHHSRSASHPISNQVLLDGKFPTTDAGGNAAATAQQEFMLQANQVPFGSPVARLAGEMSRVSSETCGGNRFGGLEKIDYTYRVQERATTSGTLPNDSKKGGAYTTTAGCGGLSLVSSVRNNPQHEHDIINYHSHSTSNRGLPVLRSDMDILSHHCSPTHTEHAGNAATSSASGDRKTSSPNTHPLNDDYMESRRRMEDEKTLSSRKHEAKSLMSTKRNKPREGAMISPTNKKRKRGEQSKEDSVSNGSAQSQKNRGEEEFNASLLEEENRSHETRQKHAANVPCMENNGIGLISSREYHPQLRQIDEEQRSFRHAILADQECIRSRLLRTAVPVLPLTYQYPYSTRSLLENVTSALFPPRGSAALGSLSGLFGVENNHTFGRRFTQALPSAGEEKLPEETHSGMVARPHMESNVPGQVYPNAREGEVSRDVSTRGRCFPLHIREDENNLSSYQVLARKQIEVFEASMEEARTNAQGRNRPIQPGEIGIRCRHCAKLPPKDRVTGAVYYPKKLDGVYQTAQKMAVNHLVDRCQEIPEEIKHRLRNLKDTTRSSDGGGKRYWAEALRTLGVREMDSGGLVWNE